MEKQTTPDVAAMIDEARQLIRDAYRHVKEIDISLADGPASSRIAKCLEQAIYELGCAEGHLELVKLVYEYQGGKL